MGSDNPGSLSIENWNQINTVQAEITRWATKQFPHRTAHHAIYKLMVEEIPELAMHIKEHGTDKIGAELADCFILLMDLASLWNVDVAEAIRYKMTVNYERIWNMDVNGIMQHVPIQNDSATGHFITGERCPNCSSQQVIKAPLHSIFTYKCIACSLLFDQDCPF